MTTMRLTDTNGKKVDVNPTHVVMLSENLLVLVTGDQLEVQESARSLRHQHRKALAAQHAVGQPETSGE